MKKQTNTSGTLKIHEQITVPNNPQFQPTGRLYILGSLLTRWERLFFKAAEYPTFTTQRIKLVQLLGNHTFFGCVNGYRVAIWADILGYKGVSVRISTRGTFFTSDGTLSYVDVEKSLEQLLKFLRSKATFPNALDELEESMREIWGSL